ncbi:MAG: hypothetical protein AABZ06_01750 [Bdellovibrionota bacterium]
MKTKYKDAFLRWKALGRRHDASVLKLAILRNMSRDVHAQKSRDLSSSSPGETSENDAVLLELERILDNLRSSTLDSNDLETLLKNTAPPLAERTLPKGLLAIIPSEKLLRRDRVWEAAIIAEGLNYHWHIWTLSASIPVAEVENWNNILADILWPGGILLYVESQDDGTNGKTWHGKWITLLAPEIDPLKFQAKLQTFDSKPPVWELIYPAT